jgi:aspartyl-tRNA synthetase
LDLRRSELHQTVLLRSKVIASIRRRMIELGFTEFQTPILTSSSPEGARDFLVPSRLYPGEFYALPQAPQQFKQLIMVSGFDRYFQIAPCFRDEDGRADRTPGEFYQLDLEMSFVTQEDVFAAMENLFYGLFTEFRPDWFSTPPPFVRIPFAESLLKYGSDKPDLRIPVEIADLTPLFAQSDFKAFAGKTVRVMAIPKAFDQPRSWFDSLQEEAKKLGAPGLAYVKISSDGKELTGPIAKFLMGDEIKAALLKIAGTEGANVLFFSADKSENRAAKVLGVMRVKIAEQLGLIEKKEEFRFAWITDYPMYELNEETNTVEFSHNPFSMPQGGLKALTEQDPLTVKAFQYDLVCNGYELASGAIRNHVPEIMFKAFSIAGYEQSVVENRFAGMINAFRYGAPPHGGMAPGIDRIVMLLAQQFNIRDVIAFPMAQNGRDLMMNAPGPVSEKQLTDVHLAIKKPMPKV